jgi:putative cell wall-binding protein
MDRPVRRAGLMVGALGLALSAAWTGFVQVGTASASGHAAHAASSLRTSGTRDLPARVRSILRHRLPDAVRPGTRAPGPSAEARQGAKGTVRIAANWSGEVEVGSNLTTVSASWRIPSVAPSSSLQFAATWVGIGGFAGTTLIQTGTIEVTATNEVGYAAWVEVIPQAAWTLTSLSTPGGTPSLVVAPGDVMHASVTYTATDEWHVTIANTTAKWSYTHTFRYSVKATSADWVTERPTIYTTATHKTVLSTLADYSSTRFSHLASAVDGDAPGSPASLTPVRMETSGYVISAPGPLSPATSSTGEAFTDSYLTVPSRVYGGTDDGTAAVELEHQFTYGAGACPRSPTSGRAVVLATDSTYPDALSSVYLASYLDTGTLLTAPTTLSATTLSAIRDEGITHVYVVGGPLAVSTAIVTELEDTSAYACGGSSPLPGTVKVEVTRIAGTTEYDTALDIAEISGATPGRVDLASAYAGVNALGGHGVYNVTAGSASASAPAGALSTAVLATGASFQDAEAASSLAYAEHLPVLLTTSFGLSAQALSAIETLHIQQVVVVGGQLAVSDAVAKTLEAHGVSVLRIAGADYTETAIELAKCELAAASSHAGFGWVGTGKLTVARGDFYSDGLAGAVVAADGPADIAPEPLLLTASPTRMGSYLPTFLAAVGTSGLGGKKVTTFTILGGPLAVSQTVANTMVVALLGS